MFGFPHQVNQDRLPLSGVCVCLLLCVCVCVCKQVYVSAQDIVNVYVVSPLLIHNMQFYFPADCMDYTWVCMKPLCIYPSA